MDKQEGRRKWVSQNVTVTLLESYGAVARPLILVLEDIRSRSDVFLKVLPLYESMGGVVEMLDSSDPVKEQWADFFVSYYLAHMELKRLFKQELGVK